MGLPMTFFGVLFIWLMGSTKKWTRSIVEGKMRTNLHLEPFSGHFFTKHKLRCYFFFGFLLLIFETFLIWTILKMNGLLFATNLPQMT